MAYFPMFIDLTDKPCLVVGGGTVAFRKIWVLLDFNARISVTAPCICQSILDIKNNISELHLREFDFHDCDGKILVVAATDDPERNSSIADYCKERNIPVNAVDQKEDCSFIFPSYVKEGSIVGAFSSGGSSPLITQKLKEENKKLISPLLGQINDTLGKWRTIIKAEFDSEEKRKVVYGKIYDMCTAHNRVLSDSEIRELIDHEY